ncbi:hypothetical protein, partial [Paracoccus rhizosphaerae]|uniref:hypothetical protein n=1 Tax=Paracoccus rhizosphaerae TaxID=1133347 RepID=UPI0022401748
LLQNADDLIFSEPAALHLWSYRLGQSLSQTGLGGGGNVKASSGSGRNMTPPVSGSTFSTSILIS